MVSFDEDNIITGGGVSELRVVAHFSNCSNPSNVNQPSPTVGWISLSSMTGSVVSGNYDAVAVFSVQANSGVDRLGYVTFGYVDDDGNQWSKNLIVNQGSGQIIKCPIYMDVEYYYPLLEVFNYSIRKNDDAFYFGRSYCAPDEGGTYVNINRICDSYLDNNLPDFRGMTNNVVDNGAVGDFGLYDTNGICKMNYRFLRAYEGSWSGQTGYDMTKPINGHIDPRMRLLCTIYNDNNASINYRIEND